MRKIEAPMYVLSNLAAVRVVNRTDGEGGVLYERYDFQTGEFVDDFDYVFDMASGFDPGTNGTEYGFDNREVTKEDFDIVIEAKEQKRLRIGLGLPSE